MLTPFGTVALGSVIAAIAAALEPQVVKTRLLLKMPVEDDYGSLRPRARASTLYSEGDVDFVAPLGQMNKNRSMWMESVTISDTQIDNTWIATVSGENFFFKFKIELGQTHAGCSIESVADNDFINRLNRA